MSGITILYLTAGIIISMGCLIGGLSLLTLKPRNHLHITLAVLGSATAWYSFFYILMSISGTVERALFFYRLSSPGWTILPVAMALFFYFMTQSDRLVSLLGC